MGRTIQRFKDLIEKDKPQFVHHAEDVPKEAFKDRRVMTIHHGESPRDAHWGEVGCSVANVLGYYIFNKTLPLAGKVVGIRMEAI